MKRYFYITLFVCLFVSFTSAQTKTVSDITDTGLGDFRTDTFKEKTLVGKVVGNGSYSGKI